MAVLVVAGQEHPGLATVVCQLFKGTTVGMALQPALLSALVAAVGQVRLVQMEQHRLPVMGGPVCRLYLLAQHLVTAAVAVGRDPMRALPPRAVRVAVALVVSLRGLHRQMAPLTLVAAVEVAEVQRVRLPAAMAAQES